MTKSLIKVAENADGEGFGEIALDIKRNGKRLATIVAMEKTHIAVLGKSDFNRILQEQETKRTNELWQYLK